MIWGLDCLVVPFVGLIFLLQDQDRVERPFLLNLASMIVMVLRAGLLQTPPS